MSTIPKRKKKPAAKKTRVKASASKAKKPVIHAKKTPQKKTKTKITKPVAKQVIVSPKKIKKLPKKDISVLTEVRDYLAHNRDAVRAAQQDLKQHQALEHLKHIKEIQEARRDLLASFNKAKGFSGKMRHSGYRGK